MSTYVVLSMLLMTLQLTAGDDAAAAAAYEGQSQAFEQKTVAQTQSQALARIQSAIEHKKVDQIFNWYPTLINPQDQDQTVFDAITTKLTPKDFSEKQLKKLEDFALQFQKENGSIPQSLELASIEWKQQFPRLFFFEQGEKAEKEIKRHKPQPPSRPAPRIIVVLHSKDKTTAFTIPRAVAVREELVGSLISTLFQNDLQLGEIDLDLPPHILKKLVRIWNLLAHVPQKIGQKTVATHIVASYPPQFLGTPEFAHECLELIHAADYLSAGELYEELIKLFVSQVPEDILRKTVAAARKQIWNDVADEFFEQKKRPLDPQRAPAPGPKKPRKNA